MFAGLDVHKESVQACVVDNTGKILEEKRFTTSQLGLNALLQTVRNSSCVIESSTACFPVYDFLQDNNIKVRVAHPKRLKAICSAKNKTDKIDAKTLAQLERVNLIPEAYIPNRTVRDQRDLVRHHVALVQQRTRLVNQTKAGLLRYRIQLPENIFTKQAQKLAEISPMPESLKLKLEHAWQEFLLLKKEICQVDERIELLAQQNKNSVLLRSIKGIGWFSAFAVVTQTDKIERFASADHFVSYSGLCPRVSQSGEKCYMENIGHDCCKLLRWILIQDAWSVVKHNLYFKKMYKKLCRKKSKQKAIVIIAKRLLRIMYFMLRDQKPFQPKKIGGGS